MKHFIDHICVSLAFASPVWTGFGVGCGVRWVAAKVGGLGVGTLASQTGLWDWNHTGRGGTCTVAGGGALLSRSGWAQLCRQVFRILQKGWTRSLSVDRCGDTYNHSEGFRK